MLSAGQVWRVDYLLVCEGVACVAEDFDFIQGGHSFVGFDFRGEFAVIVVGRRWFDFSRRHIYQVLY